jgi:uncharacterized DUF497 family protein
MRYRFEWNADKARRNRAKHGVSFRLATGVFRDPMAISVFDEDHSVAEDRWVTIGHSLEGKLLVVVHRIHEAGLVKTVRLISARRATRREKRQYEEET